MSVVEVNRLLTKHVLAELTLSPFFGTCVYCGRRCFGRACLAHDDLPLIEQRLFQESNDPSTTRLVSSGARVATERGL